MWPHPSTGHRLGGHTKSAKHEHGKKKTVRPKRLFEDLDVRPIVQAVVAFSVVCLGIYVRQGLSQDFEMLKPEDGDRLKEVFFGNDTWLVLCQTDQSQPIFAPFEGASRRLSKSSWWSSSDDASIKFGVLDCKAKLPSGRTTLQRLKLNKNIEPVVFLTSPGSKRPRQLLPRYISSTEALVKELKSATTPQAVVVRDSKSLADNCLSGEYCLLVLRGKSFGSAEESALTSTIRAYGNSVKFAAVDSILHEVSIERSLPRFNPSVTRVVIFNNQTAEGSTSGRKAGKKAEESSLRAKGYFGDFTRTGLGELIDEAMSGKLRFKKVTGIPTVSRRGTYSAPPSSTGATPPSSGPSQETSSGRRARREETQEGAAPTSTGPDAGRSKEEEARIQAAREAAIREAMERESQDFIMYEEDGEGSEGSVQEEEQEEDQEVDDVIDLDEEI